MKKLLQVAKVKKYTFWMMVLLRRFLGRYKFSWVPRNHSNAQKVATFKVHYLWIYSSEKQPSQWKMFSRFTFQYNNFIVNFIIENIGTGISHRICETKTKCFHHCHPITKLHRHFYHHQLFLKVSILKTLVLYFLYPPTTSHQLPLVFLT